MNNQPAYLQSVNIRCVGGCSQIVKSNGIPVMEHTVLNHKYSPGETALICRKCRANFNRMEWLTGNGANWTIGETVEVERPAREYETPLRRALNEIEPPKYKKPIVNIHVAGLDLIKMVTESMDETLKVLAAKKEAKKWSARNEANPIIVKSEKA